MIANPQPANLKPYDLQPETHKRSGTLPVMSFLNQPWPSGERFLVLVGYEFISIIEVS